YWYLVSAFGPAEAAQRRRRKPTVKEHVMRAHLVFVLVLLAVTSTSAQFGHPLKGSWSGDWGPNRDTRNRVLLQLTWDGKAVTGPINPGPSAVALQKTSMDPSNWTVHFEAEGKDQAGRL